jgi:hypothetical protein
MNELRPEIAPLAAAVTDTDRAKALLRMSDSALMTCEFTIRNRLRLTGFRIGIDYLDAALALLRSERNEDGCPEHELTLAVVEPWRALRLVARREASSC